MKQIILCTSFVFVLYNLNAQAVYDSVNMNPGYTKEVFYNFNDKAKTSVAFSSWDIGFQTDFMNASIISNENSITVYSVPGADSTDYATLDVSDYSNWPILFNSDTSWSIGAFNDGENLATWDFGWGIYDFNVTHEVYGNKIFVLDKGGELFKFWIRKKNVMEYRSI